MLRHSVLTLTALLAFSTFAFAQKTPPVTSPTTTPVPTVAAPPSEAPALHDKVNDYSVRTDSRPCMNSTESCSFDTIVSATARDNGSLVWERQIYTVTYDMSAKEKPHIAIKSAKLAGKLLKITNAKGDTFDLELSHGHMKSPKKPRDYTKK